MMKSILFTFLLFIASSSIKAQTVYTDQHVLFNFFSSAPIEDIKAESKDGVSALDIASRSVYFKVPIRSFKFEKGLMQEHFNENYLESDKYPNAEFRGSIKGNIDLSKDGTYEVTVQGNLDLHHVIKSYTVKAELSVKEGEISARSSFPVKLVDHNIKIPRLVIKNIAEVVQVSILAEYQHVGK